jgi:hypothetical protein
MIKTKRRLERQRVQRWKRNIERREKTSKASSKKFFASFSQNTNHNSCKFIVKNRAKLQENQKNMQQQFHA